MLQRQHAWPIAGQQMVQPSSDLSGQQRSSPDYFCWKCSPDSLVSPRRVQCVSYEVSWVRMCRWYGKRRGREGGKQTNPTHMWRALPGKQQLGFCFKIQSIENSCTTILYSKIPSPWLSLTNNMIVVKALGSLVKSFSIYTIFSGGGGRYSLPENISVPFTALIVSQGFKPSFNDF